MDLFQFMQIHLIVCQVCNESYERMEWQSIISKTFLFALYAMVHGLIQEKYLPLYLNKRLDVES